MCAYRGEFCRCCVVYGFIYKLCGDFYIENNQNTHTKKEQHIQVETQTIINDNIPDSFAAHMAKTFT